MSNRYCYIVRSKETDIVNVYTALLEAMSEGQIFAKNQGVKTAAWELVNDELTTLDIVSTDTPCEVWIERHRLK